MPAHWPLHARRCWVGKSFGSGNGALLPVGDGDVDGDLGGVLGGEIGDVAIFPTNSLRTLGILFSSGEVEKDS